MTKLLKEAEASVSKFIFLETDLFAIEYGFLDINDKNMR